MCADKHYLYIWSAELNGFITQIVLVQDDGTFFYGCKVYKRWKNMFNSAVKHCLNRKPVTSDLFYCIWNNEPLTFKQLETYTKASLFKERI